MFGLLGNVIAVLTTPNLSGISFPENGDFTHPYIMDAGRQ